MISTKKLSSLGLIKTLVFAYPKHSLFVLVCLIFAGVAEGVGIATLLPLLNMTMGAESAGSDFISRSIERFFSLFGLEPTIGLLLCLIVIAITIKALLIPLACPR